MQNGPARTDTHTHIKIGNVLPVAVTLAKKEQIMDTIALQIILENSMVPLCGGCDSQFVK